MPLTEHLREAERIMRICNACRYCEGFCAVFPAMELRRTFTEQDLKYLANLCHNCRGCYYACQYAPPHEFDLNVPKTLGRLRLGTYREFAWPGFLAGLFQGAGRFVFRLTGASVVAILILALLYSGAFGFFSAHTGKSAFYQILPYNAIVWPFSLLMLAIIFSLAGGYIRFWRATGGDLGQLGDRRANLQAVQDVLQLKYLDGGGHGCNYPDERFSMIRRWCHHFVFYGFLMCFASTTVAAVYEHILHWTAPYPLTSWPVVLGTAGGAALLLGTGALLYLKTRMDKAPAASGSMGLDLSFLILLFLTSSSGLLLLALRETAAIGTLFAVHLGLVLALFLTFPCGKFVHGIYRYAALVRNALEQSRHEE